MKKRTFWNKEKSQKEASKYKNKKAFSLQSQGAYRFALKNGFLEEICSHMEKKTYPDYTYEECKKESEKYETKTEFRKNAQYLHDYSQRKGWLKDFINFEQKSPCVQLTKEDEFVKKFESLSEVERELGLCHSTISKCCQGKLKTSGGYKWKFEKDYL